MSKQVQSCSWNYLKLLDGLGQINVVRILALVLLSLHTMQDFNTLHMLVVMRLANHPPNRLAHSYSCANHQAPEHYCPIHARTAQPEGYVSDGTVQVLGKTHPF